LVSCRGLNEKKDEKTNQPYLIMLSLDGFRWDYTEMANTPVFDSLKKVGVIAESLKPSFPTKTFPNHYTIATGLYPDHHGIVENNFHANDLGKEYSVMNRESVEDGSFYGGEPIWITAEKQGMKSATLFWVGSEADIMGMQPSIWYSYSETLSFDDRIDSVYKWLSLPEAIRPHLILWYYPEPDHTTHEVGPYSPVTIELIEALDSHLGEFFTEMRKLPIFDQLNFIILSDHGMGPTDDEHVIFIDQVVDTADIEFFDGWNPDMNIKVKPGKLEKVYSALKNTPNLFAWKHDSLPERLKYGHNVRTQDITIVAYPGWAIGSTAKPNVGGGTHGYDNDFKDMHAIFYAVGPAFKENYQHPTFENVNIYALIAEILNLVPAETDGKLENVEGMLVKPE
ncbi:MAG TPA: ectonucleotide pyrophosphatase/phosphodiesterase, partial [Bacteroidales bacterium]